MGVLTMARQRRLKGGLQIESYTGLYVMDAIGNGAQFMTSGVLKVRANTMIDAFMVGGGGAGRYGGGGGGYTKTARKIQLIAGQEYEIVIGEGGTPTQSGTSIKEITNGGDTQAFGFTAAGGLSAGQYTGDTTKSRGGNGGSGGGAGSGGNGGTNGADGGSKSAAGGTGQGYTTRAFGEEHGALYAAGGGGCAGSSSGTPGTGGEPGAGNGAYSAAADMSAKPNTGSGGGGTYTSTGRKSNGGSGIVIIRTAKAVGRQYLYSAGNEHAGFTNGWIGEAKWSQDGSGATKRANIVRESGQIVLDNSNNYAGVIRPSLGVDLTPYKTLVFEGEFTRGGAAARNLTAAVWSTIGTYYATENQMLKFYQMASAGTIDRIEIDVSDIDGLGYPGIGATMSSAKITACYLIPKD
jgi:hypothetical protein